MTKEKDKNFNYLFKYIIVGDTSVGKTKLLLRFTQNKFIDDYHPTIGIEFDAKNVEIKAKKYRIQIWDTAGAENFRSITRSYFKNSVCAMVVYDITNKISFENVSIWIKEIQEQSPKTTSIVLIGNKIDLGNREVTYEEGKEFADKNGILFQETSAKTGENVNDIFIKSAKMIVSKMDGNQYNLESESCGIMKGEKEMREEFNNKNTQNKKIEIENKNEPKNQSKKGCCSS